MSKALRLIAIACALVLPALPAFAQEAVIWECMPEAGAEVYPNDQLVYRLTITESGATEEWTVLTIRLGEGMRMETDSFVFLGAETSSPTAQGEEAPLISREIIPGNDGCVILTSSLQTGDTAVFSAAAQTETASVTATAYTDDFSVEVSHKPVPRPTQTSTPATPAVVMLPVATPTPEPEGFTISDAGRLAVGIVIFAGLLLFVGLLLRDHPIVRRFTQKLNRNRGAKSSAKSAKGRVRLSVIYAPGLKGRIKNGRRK